MLVDVGEHAHALGAVHCCCVDSAWYGRVPCCSSAFVGQGRRRVVENTSTSTTTSTTLQSAGMTKKRGLERIVFIPCPESDTGRPRAPVNKIRHCIGEEIFHQTNSGKSSEMADAKSTMVCPVSHTYIVGSFNYPYNRKREATHKAQSGPLEAKMNTCSEKQGRRSKISRKLE